MQDTKVQVKMTSSEQSSARRRMASEIIAKVMQTTRIEVVQILKRYVVGLCWDSPWHSVR